MKRRRQIQAALCFAWAVSSVSLKEKARSTNPRAPTADLSDLRKDLHKTRRSGSTVSLGHISRLYSLTPFGTATNISDLPDDAGQAEPSGAPRIILTHLLKAAGTSVETIMSSFFYSAKSYSQQNFIYGTDSQLQGQVANTVDDVVSERLNETHKDYFRIGLVREPCSYLVSLWAFQSSPYGGTTGHGSWPRQCLGMTLDETDGEADLGAYYGDVGLSGDLSDPENVHRFRSWVRVSAGAHLHYLSYREYLALHADKALLTTASGTWDDGQYYACLGKVDPAKEVEISQRLLSANFSDRYECMIRTEAVEADMTACLELYATRILDPTLKQRFLTKLEARKALPKADTHANMMSHAPCRTYIDTDTEAFIWNREGPFAEKMGYSSCCGGLG